ncbi:spermatogenesis associated 6-like protein [Esox lucius]|uniref:Spermatogenesis-associated protein 6 N-terminal domain-containing protein n=1 Tax=Esox lucius TaxID=8010 RepID=A0A3P9A6J6_ESOLU|nr:spermatogenesis associated 6-like protein [Esox lucius]
MSRKAMKVVVELQLKAVSCPGVHLTAKDDVYVSVCFLSQYYKSLCLPPVFPLLFREQMIFEKVFRYAVDPGDVAEMLECETVRVELVQLIPPVGEALACFEEDTRRFLFPEPRLVPASSGVDREVLMTRSKSFPGIAPRLEFSTRTTIGECSANTEVDSAHLRSPMRTGVPKKHPKRSRKGHMGVWSSARRASLIPRSRSLSPYKASQVDGCHDNVGRLAQLSLGSCWDLDKELSPCHMRESRLGSAHSPDPSPVMARRALTNGLAPGLPRSPSSDTDDLLDFPPGPNRRSSLADGEGSSPEPTLSPYVLCRSYGESSTQNGSRPSPQVTWEDVQQRVRGLLTSPRAMHRLAHGATDSEIDEVLARRSISPQRGPL